MSTPEITTNAQAPDLSPFEQDPYFAKDERPVVPQDISAEQCVLGGMMLSLDAIAEVAEVLRPQDFYKSEHREIYEAILDLYAGGRHAPGSPIDAMLVKSELEHRGTITKIGEAPYLHTLIETVPTAANAGFYAEKVQDKAILRRLREMNQRGLSMVDNGTLDTQDILERMSQALTEATHTDSNDVMLAGDLVDDTLDELTLIANNGGPVDGIPTGFADLDALTHGLHPGQMIVVAGRPGHGKSTLGMDFCRQASIEHGLPSVIFSLEMGRSELMLRLLAATARVRLNDMRAGRMTDAQWTAVGRAAARIKSAPLYLDDSPNLSMMAIRAKARRLKQRHDIRLFMVDYMQLMTSGSSKRAESRQGEVSEFSRGLKLLAKELEAPIIAVSQLNRGPEQRQDKKPQLSDLRESGSIEQDCDIAILLHRPDAYERDDPRMGEADLIVAKHRSGPTATIPIAHQLHFSRFVDMAQE